MNDNESDIISRLEVWTSEIQSFIGLIREVTNDTNLLAFNASVQSARAGEHGKSFSVIADEIRNLSKKTNDSIHSIEAILNESSNYSQLLIQTIAELREEKKRNASQDEIIENTKKQNNLFSQIINNVEDKIELKNPKGELYLINDAAAKEYKLQTNELIGKSVFDFYDKEIAGRYFNTEKELISKRRPQYSLERVELYGEVRFLFLNKTPILIPEYHDYGLLVIKREVSERQVNSHKFMNQLRDNYPSIIISI